MMPIKIETVSFTECTAYDCGFNHVSEVSIGESCSIILPLSPPAFGVAPPDPLKSCTTFML